jgi:hypothetical protein
MIHPARLATTRRLSICTYHAIPPGFNSLPRQHICLPTFPSTTWAHMLEPCNRNNPSFCRVHLCKDVSSPYSTACAAPSCSLAERCGYTMQVLVSCPPCGMTHNFQHAGTTGMMRYTPQWRHTTIKFTKKAIYLDWKPYGTHPALPFPL